MSIHIKVPTYFTKYQMTSVNKILQIDTKWSEMRKKHKTDDTEFLPVVGAGSRWTTIFTSRKC